MNVAITTARPTTTPIREYEARFIYVGFKFRYNTHTKTVSSIEKLSDGSMSYFEAPSHTDVFARGYASEHVRVIVYSDSPKIWCEEVSPTEYFVFSELGDNVLGQAGQA